MHEKNGQTVLGLRLSVYIMMAVLLLPASGQAFEVMATEAGLILKSDPKKIQESEWINPESERNPFTWGAQVIEEHQQQEVDTSNFLFEQLQLSGIIWDETRPMAIIDATLLGEGEQINGIRVQTIFRNEVLLESNNQHYFLKFKELLDLEKLEATSASKTGENDG